MDDIDLRDTSRKESAPPAGAEIPDDASTGPAGAEATPPESGDAAAGLRDRWLRAEAELQNYRRRAARDLEEVRRGAEESVMLDLIAAIDDLERALATTSAEGGTAAWGDGVRLVARHLRDALARRGVAVEDPAGAPFDPRFHEALLELPASTEVAPGTVLEVALKGYRRGDRALRAARVVVSRAADVE